MRVGHARRGEASSERCSWKRRADRFDYLRMKALVLGNYLVQSTEYAELSCKTHGLAVTMAVTRAVVVTSGLAFI